MDIARILRETFVAEIEHRNELGSTNNRCAELAKLGASNLPLLVIADRQTAGRGRGGHRWWTGSDSLAFSLLLETAAGKGKNAELSERRPDTRPKDIVPDSRLNNIALRHDYATNILMSLAAGVAVAETVKPLLHHAEVGILWPNDVMADGRKLAGILIEVTPGGRMIIGIGINTNNSMTDAPDELTPIATTLFELTGKRQDHAAILISLLHHLEENIIALKRAPADIAARADGICLQRDKPLSIEFGRQIITGICRGIATDGALLLETLQGIRSFHSGSIIK
jgi:BirA family transcriptional regulator, biotin operon repressor / biotin---[acetyl-CoA-carboxylase] ligase